MKDRQNFHDDLPSRYVLTCYLHRIECRLGIGACARFLCGPVVLRCSRTRVAGLSSRIRQRRAVLATVFEILEFRLLVTMLREII